VAAVITTIALVVGAIALIALAVAAYAGWQARREEIAGEQIAERLRRYDYRSGTFKL
jgi:FtsZ-interacting cell division protein ZipA